MKVDDQHYRTIWLGADGTPVQTIDQRWLPHHFRRARLRHRRGRRARHPQHVGARRAADRRHRRLRHGARHGRRSVRCRARRAPRRRCTRRARRRSICAGRWTTCGAADAAAAGNAREAAYRRAAEIADEDVELCRAIGENGLASINRGLQAARRARSTSLTHCNAGWLATVDYGTAPAPIYLAHDAGIPSTSMSTRRGRATRAPA